MKATDDLFDRQARGRGPRPVRSPAACRRASADLGDGGGVVVADGEVGSDPAGPVDEEFDGLVGQRQRRHLKCHFARHAGRLTAGRQNLEARAGGQQLGGQRCGGVEQVLAVVQHDQCLPVAHELRQRLHRRAARLVGQAECTGDGHRHHGLVGDRCQVDVGDAVAILGRNPCRDLNRQPRLARTACTRQRDEPVVGQ